MKRTARFQMLRDDSVWVSLEIDLDAVDGDDLNEILQKVRSVFADGQVADDIAAENVDSPKRRQGEPIQ